MTDQAGFSNRLTHFSNDDCGSGGKLRPQFSEEARAFFVATAPGKGAGSRSSLPLTLQISRPGCPPNIWLSSVRLRKPARRRPS